VGKTDMTILVEQGVNCWEKNEISSLFSFSPI